MTTEEKRKATKEKLANCNITGFQTRLKEYLSINGITISLPTINRVCNPDAKYWNNDVAKAGLDLIRQYEESEEEIHLRASDL